MPEPIVSHSKFGLFLHAAAVDGPYGAILLMGHSCSGKTTLSSLLSDHFYLIADDLVFARSLNNGIWGVMSGRQIKSMVYENDSTYKEILQEEDRWYPLHAIVRIFAAQHTDLKPLSSIKTCEYLMDAVFEIDIQRKKTRPDLAQRWFQFAVLMARQYPGWQLQFSLEKQSVVSLLQKRLDETIIKISDN